ncbi:MAG: TIGR04086 family membrane protein [Clostridia bacterium]|jgi:putative membrane protein (TIGR04086 family)|nr:TIGR04086 family membrane protein [Clostridia bacterium]
MKNITQTVTSQSKNDILYIVKGIVLAYFITFLLLFAFSIILTYTSISENTIAPIILMITIISILIGSSLSSSKIKKNGLINGGIIGFLYIMTLYLISSFIQTGFNLNLYAILMIVFSILAGMVRRNCRSKPKKIKGRVGN